MKTSTLLKRLLGGRSTRKQRAYLKRKYSKPGLLTRLLKPQNKQEYGQPSYTLRGEVVRSEAEASIADWFTRRGIQYQYEPPLMDGLILKKARFYADFFLPQFNTYVEYWGLAYKESQYMQKMRYKMDYYRSRGLRLVSIYPNNLSNLDSLLKQELGRLSSYCTKCGQLYIPSDEYCSHCGNKNANS